MRPTVLLTSLLMLSACAAPSPGEAGNPPPLADEREPAAREQAARARLERLERVEPPPPTVAGEVPAELLERIRADAAGRLGVAPAALEVVRAESVTWSDGALGCPRPDVLYTQALEPGYWVVLRAGERQLDYRARESGYFFVCEDPKEKGLPR
jgi:hypothetical protein